MDFRLAAELMHPTVEFGWIGDNSPASLATYANIQDWDRNGTSIPKPTEQTLTDYYNNTVAPLLTQAALEDTRTGEARTNLNTSFSGIRGLPTLDQVTIIFARGLFVEEGGSGAGALAIDTLAEANSTITGSAWWGAMTVAQRAQWNTFLNVLRRILQGLLLTR